MANIEKNNNEENKNKLEHKKSSTEKAVERVQKLSWWAKLFLVGFFGFVFTVVSFFIAINLPSVKNWIAEKAINYLNDEFGTTFSTAKVEINFFGDVVITDLRAKDHRDFQFLRAEKLVAHTDWFGILASLKDRDLKFNKLSVDQLDLKVITYKGENQDNFTKYIAKFDSPRDPKKKAFQFGTRIDINDSKLSIVNENQGEDGQWLKAEKLNAYVSKLQTQGPNVSLKLNELSFITERWGKKHTLQNLSGDIEVTKEKFSFTGLIFQTDRSLLQGDLVFNLDKKTGWQDFNQKVIWDMDVKGRSNVDAYDISYFVKNWDNYQNYHLSGKMAGPLRDFTLRDFILKVRDNEIRTPKIQLTNLVGNGEMRIISNNIFMNVTYVGLKASLPTFVASKMGNFADEFGRIKYTGQVDVDKTRVIAKGDLLTDIGQAKISEFLLQEYSSKFPKYTAKAILKDFNTSAITKSKEVGKVSGNFDVKGQGFDVNTLSLTTNSDIQSIEISNKTLNNIKLDGSLVKKQYNGLIDIRDERAKARVEGKIDFSSKRIFADLQGDVDYLDLAYFGVSKEKSTFRGRFNGKASFSNVNDLVLEADLNNVLVNGAKDIHIPNGKVKLLHENNNRIIDVDIPNVIKGNISGRFDLGNIGGMFEEAMGRVFVGNKIKRYYRGQSFTMDIDVHQDLVDYFEPNVKIPDGAKITGSFDGNVNHLVFSLNAPSLKYIMEKKEEISQADRLLAQANPEYSVREVVTRDSAMVENIVLKINTANPQEYWSAKIDRAVYRNSLLKDVNINAQNINNEKLNIATTFQVGTLEKEKNGEMVDYAANIEQSTNANGDYVLKFNPTKLAISNFDWMVDTSPELNHSITYRKKTKDFVIQNLKLYSDESEILVNGVFKSGKNFDLSGNLKNVDISKVLATAFKDSTYDIKGIANGDLKVRMNESTLEPDIDLTINDIMMNGRVIGNMIIDAENSGTNNVYNINAKITNSELLGSDRFVLNGTIDNNTKSPTLNLKADFNEFDVAFAQVFVNSIFSNLRGFATGQLAINGTLNDVNYAGDVALKDFGLKLNFSGVDYAFDDTTVAVSNSNLIFNLVGLKDTRTQSRGMISIGRISLSDLSNIGADLLIRADDLMLLNTTQRDFDLFWGKVYSRGDLFVAYENNTLKIDATADILENSVFTLNSNSASSIDEFKMLRFLEVDKEGNVEVAEMKRTGLALNINLDISADKNSTVNVLVGDEVGDISVRGETKNMKFSLDKSGNVRMLGTYLVDSGTYVSKAILEKIFHIEKGSKIEWSGDVMNPDLDILASYNALVSNASEYLGVGSLPAIKVKLQTKITDKLTSPNIQPIITASEVSSQIRDVMSYKMATEEEKVLQFASILALGNFNVSTASDNFYAMGAGVNLFFKQLSSAFNTLNEMFQLDIDYTAKNNFTNTGDRATTSLSVKFSPRWKLKTGVGVPLSNSSNVQENYLSGEGIIEYDWSKAIDGSKVFRVYSKPSNIGLATGRSANANQSYGGGVVLSYSFNRLFPRKNKKSKKEDMQVSKKDTIANDTIKVP